MRELSQALLGVTLGLLQAYHFLLGGSIVHPLQPASYSSPEIRFGCGPRRTTDYERTHASEMNEKKIFGESQVARGQREVYYFTLRLCLFAPLRFLSHN